MFVPSVAIPAPTVSPSVVASSARGCRRGRIYPITVANGPQVVVVDPVKPIQLTTGARAAPVSGQPSYWNMLLGALTGAGVQYLASGRLTGFYKLSPVALFAATFFLSSTRSPGLREFMMVAALTSGATIGVTELMKREKRATPAQASIAAQRRPTPIQASIEARRRP